MTPNRNTQISKYLSLILRHQPESTNLYLAANVWNIDTGAAFKGRLSVLAIDTKEFWQSEPVYSLYPDESGRN